MSGSILRKEGSVFSATLKKHGNSYVLRVPPRIAKYYTIGETMKVTVKPMFRKG